MSQTPSAVLLMPVVESEVSMVILASGLTASYAVHRQAGAALVASQGFLGAGAEQAVDAAAGLVAVAFPFLERGGNFVGAAEHVAYADWLSHRECVNHAGFATLARRVQQDFFRFAGNRTGQARLHEHFVDFTGDKTVGFFEVLGRSLCAINRRAFPFHAQYGLGGFSQGKTEQSVSAVQIQEMVFLA